MQLVCISDMHGELPELPAGELLIIAGDICPDGVAAAQGNWVRSWFIPWAGQLAFPKILAVWGNHDFIGLPKNRMHLPTFPEKITFLNCERYYWGGFTFWGSPHQVECGWAFGEDEAGLQMIYNGIPPGTDVLITHGPPLMAGDLAPSLTEPGKWVRAGSFSLSRAIMRVGPTLAVCGHIHEAAGDYRLGRTTVVNCAQTVREMVLEKS